MAKNKVKAKSQRKSRCSDLSSKGKQDVITVPTPDSSICYSDSDESAIELIITEAQITPECINDQAEKDNVETTVQYCVSDCLHDRKQGDGAMSRCCGCMVWYHLPCLKEDEEEGESFWTCPSCRSLSSQVKRLNECVNSMNRKVDNLYMKLNDMYHLNVKLLSAVNKSNTENKLLRQQLSTVNKCNVQTCKYVLTESSETSFSNSRLTGGASKSEPIINNHPSSPKKDDSPIVHDNVKSCILNIVCDSIPRYVNKSLLSKGCGMKAEVVQLAPTVNEAVDYVQDQADPAAVTLIHTGTRNLRKDSAKTIISRFERLEANIKHRKLKRIAVSGIVYRNDDRSRDKTTVVNTYIKEMCQRNKWCYVDNDNIDNTCLWKDGVHLNSKGKLRLTNNFTYNILNFTKQMSLLQP